MSRTPEQKLLDDNEEMQLFQETLAVERVRTLLKHTSLELGFEGSDIAGHNFTQALLTACKATIKASHRHGKDVAIDCYCCMSRNLIDIMEGF